MSFEKYVMCLIQIGNITCMFFDFMSNFPRVYKLASPAIALFSTAGRHISATSPSVGLRHRNNSLVERRRIALLWECRRPRAGRGFAKGPLGWHRQRSSSGQSISMSMSMYLIVIVWAALQIPGRMGLVYCAHDFVIFWDLYPFSWVLGGFQHVSNCMRFHRGTWCMYIASPITNINAQAGFQ